MERISYGKLAEGEKGLNEILNNLGIAITKEDRMHRAFSIIRELSEVYSDDIKFDAFVQKYGQDVIASSLHDANMINHIIPHLKDIDPDILKEKMTILLQGKLFHEEDVATSSSRNILFELTMYAYLKEAGLDANLCKINPDILLKIGGVNYNIECKRIFTETPNSVDRNVMDASHQLRKVKEVGEHGEVNHCIIALSIEQLVSKKRKLVSKDPQEGLKMIRDDIVKFINKYSNRLWRNKGKIRHGNLIGIILYANTIAITDDRSIQSNMTEIVVSNVVDVTDKKYLKMKEDFKPILDSVNSKFFT
jgi:hypothetical protein